MDAKLIRYHISTSVNNFGFFKNKSSFLINCGFIQKHLFRQIMFVPINPYKTTNLDKESKPK